MNATGWAADVARGLDHPRSVEALKQRLAAAQAPRISHPISNGQVDAIFARALNGIRESNRKAALVLEDVAEMRSEAEAGYRAALDAFDWSFGFTEDGRVYRDGFQSLQRLRAMQQDVDPDGAIWMAHSGVEQFGAPRPIVRDAV